MVGRMAVRLLAAGSPSEIHHQRLAMVEFLLAGDRAAPPMALAVRDLDLAEVQVVRLHLEGSRVVVLAEVAGGRHRPVVE